MSYQSILHRDSSTIFLFIVFSSLAYVENALRVYFIFHYKLYCGSLYYRVKWFQVGTYTSGNWKHEYSSSLQFFLYSWWNWLFKLFRHGDRMPEKREMYPNDPSKAFVYKPYVYGELTKVSIHRSTPYCKAYYYLLGRQNKIINKENTNLPEHRSWWSSFRSLFYAQST